MIVLRKLKWDRDESKSKFSNGVKFKLSMYIFCNILSSVHWHLLGRGGAYIQSRKINDIKARSIGIYIITVGS